MSSDLSAPAPTRPDESGANGSAPVADGRVVWRSEAARPTTGGPQGRNLVGVLSENRYRIYPLVALVAVISAWEALVVIRQIPPIYLPAPTFIAETFVQLVQDPGFLGHLTATLRRIFLGFLLGASLGVLVGLLMGRWRAVQAIADTFISMLYPLPKIALIPLLIVWLGLGDSYKIAISALSAFFPVVISTYVSIGQVDYRLLKAARDLGCTGSRLYRRVILPAALPGIMGGVRLGLGVSIILVIGAEMVGGNLGIGYLLIFAGQVLQINRVFAILVVLTIIGYVLLKGEQVIENLLMPWRHSRDGGVAI